MLNVAVMSEAHSVCVHVKRRKSNIKSISIKAQNLEGALWTRPETACHMLEGQRSVVAKLQNQISHPSQYVSQLICLLYLQLSVVTVGPLEVIRDFEDETRRQGCSSYSVTLLINQYPGLCWQAE